MKSKIFLCLLLIVAMLAFVGCKDNGKADGTLNNGVNDAVDDMDRAVDGNDNGNFGSGNAGDAKQNENNGNGTTGVNNQSKTSNGALANDTL